MPASVRHRARAPQLELRTPLVALPAARQIVEETGAWLGVPLPARYAHGLAHRARMTFAHSAAFRTRLSRPGDAGRDHLHAFLRHWLAARLHAEQPDLYRRLPRDFRAGAGLPARSESAGHLSPEARLLSIA